MAEVASVLYGREDIRRRVEELGDAIAEDYAGRAPVLVTVLKGGAVFLADLMRAVPLALEPHFMAISRYGDAEESLGRVQILLDVDIDLAGRDVILVEDIVDTGLTLRYLLGVLRRRGPASLEVCTLLDKSVRRIVPITPRYVGFECPDRFVLGYGLDFRERFRNLPDILQVDDLDTLEADPEVLTPLSPGPEIARARERNRRDRAPLGSVARAGTRGYARTTMIEMELTGVRVELPTNQPIVLLRERSGERYLPIWIGAAEAAAIALSLQGVVTPRPMTHDLLRTILEDLAVDVRRIEVTELRESTFFATIAMNREGEDYEISSRPSDAIALAVRMSVPIFVHEDVLEEASILIPDDEDEEVEKFREFLDTVTPEDFAG